MPYKDPVNEHVKRVVSSINRRFIAHTDLLGSTNAINSKNPSVEPQGSSLLGQGRVIGGSKGCASWSAGAATKHYEKTDEPSEKSGGAILGLQDGTLAGDRSKPKYSQTSYKAPETDNTGKFGALGDAFASRLDAVPLGPVASNSRSAYAHKDDSPLETQDLAYAQREGLTGGLFPSKANKKRNLDKEKFLKRVSALTPEERAASAEQEYQAKVDAFNRLSEEEKEAYNENWIRTHPERHDTTGMASDTAWVKPPTKQPSFWDDFGSGIKQGLSFAKPLIGMIPGVGSAAETAMSMAGMGAPSECCCPRLKSGKAPKRCKCGFKMAGKGMSGGSGFAAGTHMDVGSGETFGISSHKPTRGAGRPRKTGGAVLGLVKAPVAGPLDNSPPTYGNKQVGPKATGKKELDKPTTKADMPSSTLSGMGKRNARAEIVKKVMKERGVKLMEASSIVKKEGLYKP
jgi:hypothetical protein